MNLAIHGSFEAYVWAALWQAALGGLQAGGPIFQPPPPTNDGIRQLQYHISFIGSMVSWIGWGLGLWVGAEEGAVAGGFFVVFSFAASLVTLIELKRLAAHATVIQVGSLVMMPLFGFNTLEAIGLIR